jgi:hypothetical protein
MQMDWVFELAWSYHYTVLGASEANDTFDILVDVFCMTCNLAVVSFGRWLCTPAIEFGSARLHGLQDEWRLVLQSHCT